jgi:hypothetical protein
MAELRPVGGVPRTRIGVLRSSGHQEPQLGMHDVGIFFRLHVPSWLVVVAPKFTHSTPFGPPLCYGNRWHPAAMPANTQIAQCMSKFIIGPR